jgi:hypothetical protein
MKTQILRLSISLITLLQAQQLSAQCPYDNSPYMTGPAPSTIGSSIIAPATWGGDYNTVTGMVAGYTYEISTCGSATFDSEITIYPAGGGTAVAYDDDGCGVLGGSSKILFTPAVSGDYDILLDEYGCLDNQVDMDMTITLNSTNGGGPVGQALNIPVVVHVVYKNQNENISDAQIMSQINALNADYRKLNADFNNAPGVFQSLGTDMEINFCLAAFDPNGNPTSGITRTATTVQAFSQTLDPKSASNGGYDNWDPTKYLNLWVCDLDGGLLGFATFPSDLATAPQLDGVVIDFAYFGTTGTATAPYNLGRTATHEVGHWLNLRHVWGDASCGDDFVNDTPTQEQPNYGCPAFPHVSCSNGTNGDLFVDFMDYTDDACMMLFSQGQKARASATIQTLRPGLATSTGCEITNGITEKGNDFSFTVAPNPATNITSITISGASNKDYNMTIYNITGAEVRNTMIHANEKTNVSLDGMMKGIYFIRLQNEAQTMTKKLVIQ